MSGMLAPMGIISGAMSEHFGQPVTEITARFGWLTFGILIGAVIALFIFDRIRLKYLMMIVYSVILTCIISLFFLSNLALIGIALGLVGGQGITGNIGFCQRRNVAPMSVKTERAPGCASTCPAGSVNSISPSPLRP